MHALVTLFAAIRAPMAHHEHSALARSLPSLPQSIMEIYVLKEGARRGPFQPFKLRELLEDKVFSPSDPGWMEGMEAWAPLHAIEALRAWVPRDPTQPPPLPTPEELAAPSGQNESKATADPEIDPVIKEWSARRRRAWTRWMARLIDVLLWWVVVWMAALAAGFLTQWDLILAPPFFVIGAAVVWLPVEAGLLAWLGTAPGKWMLGIAITDDLGQRLSFLTALKRTALVQLTGNAIGLSLYMMPGLISVYANLTLVPMIQAVLGWVMYQRTGSTLWDQAANSRLVHSPVGAFGIISTIVTLVLWIGLGIWITVTVPLPVDMPEDLRSHFLEMRLESERLFQQISLPPKSPPTALLGPNAPFVI